MDQSTSKTQHPATPELTVVSAAVTQPNEDKSLKIGNRKVVTDYYFDSGVTDEPGKYAQTVFIRLNARKKLRFEKVSFQHCVFDGCYINNCVFDTCDFTGCRFLGSNFHQSSFVQCKFDYATFERTQVDDEILISEAPRAENLRMRFARSLRMNYSQIGDARAVNAAITVELEATETYLRKSWQLDETYYKLKYPGTKALKQFGRWIQFKALDIIWGNGESVIKLLRTLLICIVGMTLYDTISHGNATNLLDYWTRFLVAPMVFLGIDRGDYSNLAVSCVTAARFVGVALLTTLLVKRFGRR